MYFLSVSLVTWHAVWDPEILLLMFHRMALLGTGENVQQLSVLALAEDLGSILSFGFYCYEETPQSWQLLQRNHSVEVTAYSFRSSFHSPHGGSVMVCRQMWY